MSLHFWELPILYNGPSGQSTPCRISKYHYILVDVPNVYMIRFKSSVRVRSLRRSLLSPVLCRIASSSSSLSRLLLSELFHPRCLWLSRCVRAAIGFLAILCVGGLGLLWDSVDLFPTFVFFAVLTETFFHRDQKRMRSLFGVEVCGKKLPGVGLSGRAFWVRVAGDRCQRSVNGCYFSY